MTETYLLINQIHATLPAPARQTLHAWEGTPCWLWHCQGRAVALLVGRWDVPGKGGVHPPVSECASLAFLGADTLGVPSAGCSTSVLWQC